jgi:hypothetical protein
MKNYKCPVCGSSLSKRHYDEALGIVEAQQKVIRAERLQIARERQRLAARVADAKAMAEIKALQRTQRLVQGKDKMIESLKNTVRQLKHGTTPQTEGLEFEANLTTRLRKEFPLDMIEHKGKSGDIVHTIVDTKEKCGVIVYELKRTRFVQSDHIRQAARARMERAADMSILVTTGARRGFNGFSSFDGIPIVAPQGVVPLVTILRDHLVQMHHANLAKDQREIVAKKIVAFLSGPQFKNRLENLIQVAKDLQNMVKAEAKSHMKNWETRWAHYQNVLWNSGQITADIALLFQGKDAPQRQQPRLPPPLLLETTQSA